jgi:putative transcription antitermination factor YqgF
LEKEAKVIFSIDYGTKNIGICVAETFTGQTKPLQIIKNDNSMPSVFDKLFEEWMPNMMLIGIPSKMKENFENELNKFKTFMQSRYKIELIMINEDFTSQGLDSDKKKKMKDSHSAELIFEDWFNQNYG